MRHSARATHLWRWLNWGCMLILTPLLLSPTPARAPLPLVIPALWALRRVILGRFVQRTPVDLCVLVLLVMGGVGFCVSPDPRWSQLKIDGLTLGIVIMYATVDLLEPDEALRGVPAGVIAVGLALFGLGVVGTGWGLKIPQLEAVGASLPGEVAWLPEGETSFNPNVIGGALLWMLPLSLSVILWALRRRERSWGQAAAQSVIALIGLGLLGMTQARGAWLGFVAGLMILLVIAGGHWGRLLAVLFLIVLLVLLVAGPAAVRQAIQLDGESARILSTVSMEQRLEIWSRAQYAIADFPFTRLGLDAFQCVMPILYPLFQTPIDRLVPHAHNEFLQVALDLGLPGLVAWLALYVVTFWMLWRTYRCAADDLMRALALGCPGVLTAHLVYAMTDCAEGRFTRRGRHG